MLLYRDDDSSSEHHLYIGIGHMTESRLSIEALVTHQLGPYSLEIAPGECVSLAGPSGSGKSLLLRAIADLDAHDGQVYLNGLACNTFEGPDWRKKVSLIPAESQWWFDEVGDHFKTNNSENNPPDPRTYFKKLGFDEQTLGWQISRLSSGEKQRLALVRALMNQPEVLLLDEPTGSLDPASINAVENLVKHYQNETGAAIVWVSHDADQSARVSQRHFQLGPEKLQEIFL